MQKLSTSARGVGSCVFSTLNLRLQVIKTSHAGSVGACRLNHAQESSYKICLNPLKTNVGVSVSGFTIPDTALLTHQADFPLI